MLWDTHVLPRLGSLMLRDLTPAVINRFRLELEADGAGRVSIAKAMTLLQGVLQRACEWDRLATNPARAVRKPSSAHEERYAARDRTLFALENDIRNGESNGLALPALPPRHERRTNPATVRQIALPGLDD